MILYRRPREDGPEQSRAVDDPEFRRSTSMRESTEILLFTCRKPQNFLRASREKQLIIKIFVRAKRHERFLRDARWKL